MSAIRKNIVCEKRNKLEDVIPLNGPYTVAIDPSNLCNFSAIQYKEEKLNFKKQFMSFELFKKIIDDLKAFPEKLKVLRINGQGEPLLNPDICDMIRYAKESHVADYIETITNGSRLNPSLNRKLIDSGIDRIRISVEALDREGYQKIAGVEMDFEEFLANIEDLHDISGQCEIYCKIVDVAVPTEELKNKFFELFGKICDRIFIDNVVPLWSDFDELNAVVGKGGGYTGRRSRMLLCAHILFTVLLSTLMGMSLCVAQIGRESLF